MQSSSAAEQKRKAICDRCARPMSTVAGCCTGTLATLVPVDVLASHLSRPDSLSVSRQAARHAAIAFSSAASSASSTARACTAMTRASTSRIFCRMARRIASTETVTVAGGGAFGLGMT